MNNTVGSWLDVIFTSIQSRWMVPSRRWFYISSLDNDTWKSRRSASIYSNTKNGDLWIQRLFFIPESQGPINVLLIWFLFIELSRNPMAWRIGIDFGRSASLVPFSFDAFLVCIRERRFDPGLYSYFSHRTISSTDSKNLHLDDWLSLSLFLRREPN